ncbi:MAG: MMPL family transporter [Lachnospiraceae bacterium]|nr:MMPL family transporter [Lachnospiraceae bacterium]
MQQEEQTEKGSNQALLKICAFIVDKRNLFFLIFIILMVASVFTKNLVSVENSMSFYLPQSTETRQGLDLMEEEFITYGACDVMIANISYDQGEKIRDDMLDIDGVFSVDYDDSPDHYNNGSGKFSITFEYPEKDDTCLVLLDKVKELVAPYDSYVSTSLGNAQSEQIAEEMKLISVLVVIVVLSVLLLTTEAYAEIPVLLLTFGAAAVLHMGSNFVFGTISFVSDSVTIVLQLALSVDYAVIFLNRYKEEHQTLPYREAVIIALSKAIPEIAGSSLTTIGGLIAMTFMQYKMGPDMGIVLIKSILLSLLGVFLLMPGILMLFSQLMEKTKHKNFVPKIPFVGKFAYATRFFIPPIFLVLIIAGYIISGKCPYVYGYSTIETPLKNKSQITDKMIGESFADENMVAFIVPAGDYDKEAELIADLEAREEVDHIQGLANIEALNGYTLTDKLTPRQFSELLNIDYEVAELIYTAYAVDDENYAKAVNGLEGYSVPLIDMFMFAYKEVDEGYVTLDDEMMETLEDAHKMMNFAKEQLQGENYSRMLVYLTLPEESERTFRFLDEMHDIAHNYYDGKVLVCGETVSQYDLQKTFARDNMVVNIVSILVVLVVLLFSFKSAGMPVLLIIVIQGSIWINFSVPTLQGANIFFMSYLIVSSIQMGANIDYAIVIAGRYTELRETMGRKEAIIDTMNAAFPTIITSGTMLALAGILIGNLTSDVAIFNIGQCLGRGTLISIFITMFVLPQILLVGDTIISKTAFVMNMPIRTKQATGFMRVDGIVRGRVNGIVTGTMHAIVRGEVSAYVEGGGVVEYQKGNEELMAIEAGDNDRRQSEIKDSSNDTDKGSEITKAPDAPDEDKGEKKEKVKESVKMNKKEAKLEIKSREKEKNGGDHDNNTKEIAKEDKAHE